MVIKKYFPFFLLILACQKSQTQPEPPKSIAYEITPKATPLSGVAIKEASGIADSKSRPGHIWVEQDSGNPPILHLLNHDGTVTDSVLLEGATNRDWEDIALGKGPVNDINYLYVAEIGDNNAKYPDYAFYRFEEPGPGVKKVSDFDKIIFTYPDSSHDAEAFLVDNLTKDIFIITKRDKKSLLYKLAYPQSTTSVNQAAYAGVLDYTSVVSASLSSNGEEIIIKTYSKLYHYKRKAGEAITTALANAPVVLGYQVEAQGESVTFAIDGSGFFTLSEEVMSIEPMLNFYKKKE